MVTCVQILGFSSGDCASSGFLAVLTFLLRLIQAEALSFLGGLEVGEAIDL